MTHGYSKLVGGPEHFAETLHAFGVPVPGLMGWIIIVVELVGGLAVLIGAFVRWFSFPLVTILTCAYIYVAAALRFSIAQAPGSHLNRDSIRHEPGYEIDLLYLACLAALVIGGTRQLSPDVLFAKFKSKRATPRTGQSVSGQATRSR